MHDIGNIHILGSILKKPDKLTNEEYITMRKHASFSRDFFEEDNNFTRIKTDIALFHYERADGKDYPLDFKDDENPEIGYLGAIVNKTYDLYKHKKDKINEVISPASLGLDNDIVNIQ